MATTSPTSLETRERESASPEIEVETGGRDSLLRNPPPSSQPAGGGGGDAKRGWGTVKDSVVGGALKFVGLKPYKQEQRHWGAIKESIRVGRLFSEHSPSPSMQSVQPPAPAGGRPPPLMRQSSVISSAKTSLSQGDVAAVHHLIPYPYGPAHQAPPTLTKRSTSQTDDKDGRYTKVFGDPGTTLTRGSLYNKGTGRNQAVRADVKPDLWKLVFNSISKHTAQPKPAPPIAQPRAALATDGVAMGRSFIDLGDDSDTEDVDYGGLPTITEEDFFGGDAGRLTTDHSTPEYTDSAYPIRLEPGVVSTSPGTERLPPLPTSPPSGAEGARRRRNRLTKVTDPLLKGGYDRGKGGGLGLFTLLLRFKYKHIPKSVQTELDKLLHKRPYFTYWLIVVHILIMIVSLSVYGFAPYGWDLLTQQESIQQTNLASDIVRRRVVPNVWLGPPQSDLVLLGALYGPCMRRDRQLYAGIEDDRQLESNSSGCCVRRDNSGCVQLLDSIDCPLRFADFLFNESDTSNTRAVCGTSPSTCIDPDPNLAAPGVWVVDEVLTWPICREDLNANSSAPHLTCEITGRPCCVGIQAFCIITTREHCNYLEGRFHQDAFLCSQVVCLDEGICGLLPFLKPDEPDQVYRLWIALFLHAGLLHLLLSVLFNVLILRYVEKRLGWFYTALIYILSGIGGNLVSAYFVPYNPTVGPAGCSLGIIAYLFVFLIFESRLLQSPWVEFLKLGAIVLVLFLFGLLPYFDNFAHIGGFVFGFFISGVVLPYGEYRKVFEQDALEFNSRSKQEIENEKRINKRFLIIKIVLVVIGLIIIPLLFVLFFVLFYVLQDTWSGFSFLTCIPFTSTICLDMQAAIRTRDMSTFIV